MTKKIKQTEPAESESTEIQNPSKSDAPFLARQWMNTPTGTKIFAILVCLGAVYYLGFFHGTRRDVLYTAQIKVVDSESKAPVEVLVTPSDRMDLWPKGSGNGGISVSLTDGTQFVAWVGRRSWSPVTLPI